MPKETKIFIIEILVRLKIPDTTAATALNTLRRRLYKNNDLVALLREDYWKLSIQAENNSQAKKIAQELVERTSFFVNPNKHTYTIGVLDDEQIPPDELYRKNAPDNTTRISIIVQDYEDGSCRLTEEALKHIPEYSARINSLQRGVIWTLTIKNPDKNKIRETAEQIALTKSRTQGLLCNPHYQYYQLRI